MDENKLDKFNEEMINRFQKMSYTMQYYFVGLAHKFWDEDRPMKANEKIVRLKKLGASQDKN